MMKKILTILLLFSVAYAQDTLRSKIDSKERLQIIAGRDATSGKTDDSLRVRSKYSHKFERIGGLNGVYSIKELGVKPDGTDQTGQLLWGLVKNYVKEIVVDDDTSSVFTFNTNITIPAGVRIIFKNDCKFKGAPGTQLNINNNYVEGDFNSYLFDTSLRVSNVKTPYGVVPFPWFGANTSDTNNAVPFARAMAATPLVSQPVFITAGTFSFTQAISATKSIRGEDGSILKYNPASPLTFQTFITTGASGVTVEGVEIDGSDKVYRLLRVADNNTDVRLTNLKLYDADQVGSSTENVSAISAGTGVHNLEIDHVYINRVNAKNNGIARGILISGTNTQAPSNVRIHDFTIDSCTNIGAGSWDAECLYVGDYVNTDSSGSIHIWNGYFPHVNKRAIKIMPGIPNIKIENIRGGSTRYATTTKSYSFISIYGSNVDVEGVYVDYGVFENTIELGAAGATIHNISIKHARLKHSNAGATGNDAVRVYGKNNTNITLDDIYAEYARNGIYLDCSDRYTTISNCLIKYASQSYELQGGTATAPNDHHRDIKIINNRAVKSSNPGFKLLKIDGGVFAFNSVDSIDVLMNNYGPWQDSLFNVDIVYNYNSDSTKKSPNRGKYADRPAVSNPNAMGGHEYTAVDSNYAKFRWQGGVWVKVGVGGSITGITALTGDVTASGSGSVAATIANSAVTNAKVATGIDAAKLADGSVSNTELQYINSLTSNAQTQLNGKQATLVSGTNIKTVDGQSLVGSGDVDVSVAKNAGGDSIIVTIGSNRYAVKDSIGFSPSGSVSQLLRGNGSPSSSLGSSGYVKYNSDTNDYSTSSTIPYSDLTGTPTIPSVSDGEYPLSMVYELPSLGSYGTDTAIYTVQNDKVHVGGRIIVSTGTGGAQTVALSLPPSYDGIQYPGYWAFGTAVITKTADGSKQYSPITTFQFSGTFGLSISFTAASSSEYEIRFEAFYKYGSGGT